jgi:hypothetical protein
MQCAHRLVGASLPSLCFSRRRERSERRARGFHSVPVLEDARKKHLGGGGLIARCRRLPSASATSAADASATAEGQQLQPSRPPPSPSNSAFIFGLGYTGLGLACLLLEEGW